jgi:hypothetical protein
MITGKAAILQYFESIAQPYFAIFYKGQVEKGNAIFRNDKEGDREYDFPEGKAKFENTLELLGYGDYTVVIAEKKNVTARGCSRVDFKIGIQEAAAPAQQQVAGIGSVSMADVEAKANEIATKRFQELIDKKELVDTKAQLAEMQKEVKDYERKVNDPFNKFLNAAAPHAEHIISGLFGTKQQQAAVVLSGVNADEVGEADATGQQIIENFIETLAAAKPDNWQAILLQLTTLIKQDPAKFETALKFL